MLSKEDEETEKEWEDVEKFGKKELCGIGTFFAAAASILMYEVNNK